MEGLIGKERNDLSASFLIPEQEAGRQMLLERYKETENLKEVMVIVPNQNFPPNFSTCTKTDNVSRCLSDDGSLAAIVVPIRESDILFGYLFKAKQINQTGWWIFRYAIVAFLALLSIVVTIIALITKMYRQVAASIRTLEVWTGKVMTGNDSEDFPHVHFLEFKTLGGNIKKIIDDGSELKKQALTSEIAKQVAHDIRAPLSALSIVVDCLGENAISDASKMMMINATQRIKDIADSLIQQKKTFDLNQKKTIAKLSDQIEMIVTEKQLQFRHLDRVKISFENNFPEAASEINAVEFKRALSNLINNSIESILEEGNVLVRLSRENSKVALLIKDNGSGIPSEILSRLGKRGVTYGKDGSGLGVYHASKTIRQFSGDIEFQSALGEGTTIKITLPNVQQAQNSILVPVTSTTQIIIVDDDPITHQAWDMKCEELTDSSNLRLFHFSSYLEIKDWHSVEHSADRYFFVDYELSQNGPTGLDLIRDLDIAKDAILVSNLADDPAVLKRANSLGVRSIKKDLARIIFVKSQNFETHLNSKTGGLT